MLLLGVLAPLCPADDPIMTLRADSSTLDFSVDDRVAKGGWTLSPEFDPDVFLIRSRFPYRSKRVTFSSDLDSVTFEVKAGNNYDFTVLREGETPCRIRIAALVNPSFWRTETLAPAGVSLALFALFVAVGWGRLRPIHLLPMGVVAPIVFWGLTLISGSRIDGYSHLVNVVSELGVVGSKTEVLTSSGLVLLAILCFLFSAGLYKACRERNISTIPAWLTLSMPIMSLWAAVFPLGNELHGVLGPLPLLMTAGALLAYILWRRKEGHAIMGRLSLLSFVIMMLLFLVFMEPINGPYGGLVQRLWYAGWSIWSVSLSVCFLSASPQAAEPLTP